MTSAYVKPRYHLFGHVNELRGNKMVEGIVFSNGASLDDDYRVKNEGVIVFL